MTVELDLLQILSEVTGHPPIRFSASADLFKEGLIDSMGVVRVLLEIEKRTGTSLEAADLAAYDWGQFHHYVNLFQHLASHSCERTDERN